MRWTRMATRIGTLGVAADADGIRAIRFDGEAVPGPADRLPDGALPGDGLLDGGFLEEVVKQLEEYFAAARTTFTVPLSVPGGSRFERAVWAALAEIPYGEMWTYGQVASFVGDPGAARAVGVACNRNPLPIVVPCHRVVGADRTLVGFGGGLERKRLLLELEARVRIERDFGFS